MSYCLNSRCPHPKNAGEGRFCIQCGSPLLLGDRYRALRPISEGEIGRTFLGVDTQAASLTHCAIKQVVTANRSQNSDFLQEARRLQLLSQHPQIPTLLAYFEGEGMMPTLVQEWIEGRNIDAGIYTEAEIRQLLDETLPILHFIHEHNLIHRDLNPQNLIRPVTPRLDAPLFLVDFSTAKVTTKTALAKTGTMLGSAVYTAPEQLRGKATFSSDLYSLGLIAVHLLTGMHPFDLFSSMDGLAAWEDYLTAEVSAELRQVINRAIADAPSDRYASAAAMYEALHPGEGIPTQIEFESETALEASPPMEEEQSSLFPAWRCFRTLTGHKSSVEAIAFSLDNATMATAGADRLVRLWDLQTGKAHDISIYRHSSIITGIVWFDKYLISASWDYKICVWDTETQAEIRQLQDHCGWIQALAIDREGKVLASGSADKTIKLWDWQTGEVKATLLGHTSAILSLAFSSDGKILASGSADKTLRFWDVQTGKEQGAIAAHSDIISSIVFSPSNQLLLSASRDRTIKLWQWQTQTLLRTLTGHEGEVFAIAMNRNGNLLISGSADRTVKLWHPGSGRLLQTLSGHEAGIKAVAFSQNDGVIATGAQDQTVKLWRFM
jgi:serine/threonine protein kinase